MPDNTLKKLNAEIDKLQAEVAVMQACPPISASLPSTATFLSKADEPFKRDHKDNPWTKGNEGCVMS